MSQQQIDPEAVRRLGYKVADLYANVCVNANCLSEEDKAALLRIMKTILTPFIEGVQEIGELGENLIVEVNDE
tara:strand:+ start:449 stop:667 length:219 start_codon:yes stop_codon:yes gene_type:complete